MADHELVEQVLTWLNNWNTANAAKPTIIDRDNSDSASFNERKVAYDLTDNHAISVSSSPSRTTTAIGTGYDHRVTDAVNCRIEGAHTDQWGTIADASAFQTIIDEAERVILTERTSFPTVNGIDYHSVILRNGTNLSADEKDYFRYDVDVVFEGYEDL